MWCEARELESNNDSLMVIGNLVVAPQAPEVHAKGNCLAGQVNEYLQSNDSRDFMDMALQRKDLYFTHM